MKLFNTLPYISLLFATIVSSIGTNKAKINEQIDKTTNYYYNQLITEDSKKIYNALNKILEEDKFKTGTYTIDLIEEGF